MKQGQYIILRKLSRANYLSDPFSGRSFFEPLPTPGESEFRIESELLNKREIVELRRDPEVVSIAPPMPVTLVKPTASEEVEAQNNAGATWGALVTGAVNSPFTGQGVTVAVLDTGIDSNHKAFQGVELIQQDFTGEGNGDGNGHGTHCAGTIFGRVINGFRFSMAPGIQRALIGKVLGSRGGGSTEQIYRAILWALDQGAHIISMSLGMDFPGLVEDLVRQQYPPDLATSIALEAYRANIRLFDQLAALIYSRSALFQGTLVVAASGNESKRDINPNYELAVAPPAAADRIVAVGALRTLGEPHKALSVADFSNTGPNISAPGVDIYSTWPGGGYRLLSGTSMATPHVAGIAALWAEKLLTATGTLNLTELTARLIGQATQVQLDPGFDPLDIGAGLVQAPL